MTTTVTEQEANQRFPELLARVRAGEEAVIVSPSGAPVARLVPIIAEKQRRQVPLHVAQEIVVAPDFDDPLPDEIVDEFYQ
jgi:prevent-host-death family protein